MMETLTRHLIEHPNPSVRYLALTELRGCDPRDARVRAVRDAIPEVPPVRTILDAQYPAGYWMHPDLGVSPRYRATVWQVLFLAQLGVGPIAPVARAVAYLLDANVDAGGAFHLIQGSKGRSPALTGALLWALARMDLADDPRLTRSWAWLEDRWEAGALALPDRVWVLRAAAAWGWEGWAARLMPDLELEPPGPLIFPVTHQPDALARAEAWCEARPLTPGTSIPPGGRHVRDGLLASVQREPEGGWPLARVPGTLWFDPGPVGDPNPWVTVRVLRVLRCLSR